MITLRELPGAMLVFMHRLTLRGPSTLPRLPVGAQSKQVRSAASSDSRSSAAAPKGGVRHDAVLTWDDWD